MLPDAISLLAANPVALKAFETVANARTIRFKDLQSSLDSGKEDAQKSLSQLEEVNLIGSQDAPEQLEDFKTYYITAEGLSTERQLQSSELAKSDRAIAKSAG